MATNITMLCVGTDPNMVIQKEKVDNTEGSQSFSIVTNKHKVILPTLQLPLKGMEDKVINVRLLLDQCSQRTFVLRSALPSLQCSKVRQETLQLEGFTKTQDSKTYEIVSLSYIKKGRVKRMNAVVIDKVPGHIASKGLQKELVKVNIKGFKLADPKVTTTKEIGLLIGADYYFI